MREEWILLKTQREIKLENTCGALYDESELIDAMLWYSEKPLISVKKVAMHGNYPCVSLGKEKIHIHRLLMMYWIKSKELDGYVVHHEDLNRLNALKENLSLVYGKTHQSNHNSGKTLRESHRAKIAEANFRRKGVRHKPKRIDVTPLDVAEMKGKGMSYNKISKLTGLDWLCVKQRRLDFIHDDSGLVPGKE